MSLPAEYFDRMYAASLDPWSFVDRWYERRKRALTLAALPRPRYRSGFEPGCSIGLLTAGLATRCDRLLSTDISPVAVGRARERLAVASTLEKASTCVVEIVAGALPEWPRRRFDLVVLSEVAYYLGDDDLTSTINSAVGSLDPGGDLVAVHWRHPVADHPQSGDAVNDAIAAHPGLIRVSRLSELDFVLDVLRRVPPAARSVAQHEGIV